MMDEIDLTKYSAENPLILEKSLSPIEQVKMFNDCYFGEQEMYDDYREHFSISKEALELLNKERENTFWGNVENLCRDFISYIIERGYIPWQLNIESEDNNFIFVQLCCEDKRIESRDTGLGQP